VVASGKVKETRSFFRLAFLVVLPALAASGCFPWRAPERVKEYRSVQEALAQGARATAVNLSGKELTELPADLVKLPALARLSLRNNNLGALSAAIGDLGTLAWLDLSEARITILPDSIGKLTALQTLYLSSAR